LRVALYFVLGAQEADQAHGLRLPIDYAEHNPFLSCRDTIDPMYLIQVFLLSVSESYDSNTKIQTKCHFPAHPA
jgi:hypothetical protein